MIAGGLRPATLPEVWVALERWRERINAGVLGGQR
jgi:hypothetical protein